MLECPQIAVNQHTISYQTYGDGSQYILAFHGAFQTKEVFSPIFNNQHTHTVVAIDMPFHGSTHWNASTLSDTDVCNIFDAFMQHLNIDKITILAYSLGAKVTNAILKHRVHKLKKVIYIAPDGFKEDWWYTLAVRNAIGKRIFKICCRYPKLLSFPIWILKKSGNRNEVARKYHKALVNTDFSNTVYRVWNGFSQLQTPIVATLQFLDAAQLSVLIIYGTKDTIIASKSFVGLDVKYSNVKLHPVNAGHDLLKYQISKQYMPQILAL